MYTTCICLSLCQKFVNAVSLHWNETRQKCLGTCIPKAKFGYIQRNRFSISRGILRKTTFSKDFFFQTHARTFLSTLVFTLLFLKLIIVSKQRLRDIVVRKERGVILRNLGMIGKILEGLRWYLRDIEG